VPKEKAGIPVDEQFGAALLRDAAAEATRQRRAEKATRELAVGEIARRYPSSWIFSQPERAE
jgi:hypothetical protein